MSFSSVEDCKSGVSPQRIIVEPSSPFKTGLACIMAWPVPFCSCCQTTKDSSSTIDLVTSPPKPTTVTILSTLSGFNAFKTYLTSGVFKIS